MAWRSKLCCVPLQNGVTIIAVLQMIGSAFISILGVLVLTFGTEITKQFGMDFKGLDDARRLEDGTQIDPSVVKNIFGIVFIITGLISFFIDYLLYQGAKQRNAYYCKIWLIVAVFTGILGLIGVLGGGTYVNQLFAEIIGLIIHIYFILVVWAFRGEVLQEKYEGKQSKEKGQDFNGV